jgi:hypothetical protein
VWVPGEVQPAQDRKLLLRRPSAGGGGGRGGAAAAAAAAAEPPQRASDAITEENLDALQSQLQELHAAQLLTDDLMDAIMDTIADCIELLLMKNLQIV